MNNNDRTFINDKLTESGGAVPEALSPENISALVSGETQKKKPRSKAVPVLASLAAVFVLVVGLMFGIRSLGGIRVIRNDYRSPAQSSENAAQNEDAAQDKDEPVRAVDPAAYAFLGQIVAKGVASNDYYSYNGLWRGFGGIAKFSMADDAVYESADYAMNSNVTAAMPTAQDDGDHSELNTRTKGVDETDTVRTDGKYIYTLDTTASGYGYYGWFGVNTERLTNPQRFVVVDPNGGQMRVSGEYALTLNPAESDKITRERTFDGFYLRGDRVILTGTEMRFTEGELKYIEEEGYWDIGTDYEIEYLSVVLILDCADPAHITPVKELYFDGSLLGTRIIGDRLITVSRYLPDAETFNAEDYTTFVPRAGEDGAYVPADRIYPATEASNQYVTVSVTVLDDTYKTESTSVLGAESGLYVTAESVYTYGIRYEENGNDYEEYFCVSKVDVSGNTPVYKATGKYKGIELFDSFAIDEYGGTLRMAVQSAARYDALDTLIPAKNYLVIVDENLDVIGQSKSFGDNEYIRSVRFEEEKAYVVTFLNTDPLFVFDLSDPTNPVITGETKLPGYSAYLHPAGEGYMLGVGYDGTEEGITDAAKISLFDVSDPENPKEVDKLILSSGNFDTDYKSFITKGENGFIVTFSQWGDTYSSGAVYFTVENGKIVSRSRMDLPENCWNKRAVFIGSALYFVVTRTEYKTAVDDYGYSYDEYVRSLFEMYSFNLSSGDMIAKLEL